MGNLQPVEVAETDTSVVLVETEVSAKSSDLGDLAKDVTDFEPEDLFDHAELAAREAGARIIVDEQLERSSVTSNMYELSELFDDAELAAR